MNETTKNVQTFFRVVAYSMIVRDESESQGAVIDDSEREWGMASLYCGLKWSAIESSSHALLSIGLPQEWKLAPASDLTNPVAITAHLISI
ncbi:hypothetical protein NC652_032992 [Populus alba x Populus x berolinensis]|nr:hypothetical protein NC652_032992 [Populus alba x Populus x berolinensis]